MFATRLGTPTDTDLSGTLQEIREFAEEFGKEQVLLFFRKSADVDEHLANFREEMRTKALYLEYDNAEDFGYTLRHQLDLVVNGLAPDHRVREELGNEALLTRQQKLQLEIDTARKDAEVIRIRKTAFFGR